MEMEMDMDMELCLQCYGKKNIVFHGLNLNFPNRSSHFGASPPFSEKFIYLHTFRESNKVNIPYISWRFKWENQLYMVDFQLPRLITGG